MVLVLTGPVRSGKTTFLRKLLPELKAQMVPLSGYLSLSKIVNGNTAGYDLFDINKGASIPFLRTEGDAGWLKVGPYYFLPSGLESAAALILGNRPGEILIVDEVGPTELDGRGVWPALSEALSRPAFNCLLVVRKPLLDEFKHRLGRAPVRVFDVEQKDVRPALIRALSRLKVIRRKPGRFGGMITPHRLKGGK